MATSVYDFITALDLKVFGELPSGKKLTLPTVSFKQEKGLNNAINTLHSCAMGHLGVYN